MKTSKTITADKQNKSVMQELRDIRDKISLDIQNMNFEQLKEYIDARLTLHPKTVWQKEGEATSLVKEKTTLYKAKKK